MVLLPNTGSVVVRSSQGRFVVVVVSKPRGLLWCVPLRGVFVFKTTGSVVVRSPQEHFFLRVLAQASSCLVICGPTSLTIMIWSYFLIFCKNSGSNL